MALNLFKKKERESENNQELAQNINQGQENIIPAEKLEEEKYNTAEALNNLKNFMEAKGGLEPEEVEQISKLEFDKLAELLKEEPIEISAKGDKIISDLEQAMTNIDQESKSAWLSRFANKPLVKAAFLSLILLLKNSPDSQAQNINSQEKIIDKKELATNTEKENNAKTFISQASDFEREKNIELESIESSFLNLEKSSRLYLTNYFETDLDKIPENNQKIIVEQFKNFLNKIDRENFESLINTDFEIYGSSDERPTNNWKNGNEELTKARIIAIEKIMMEILQKHDFSNNGLSQEQIQLLKNKPFSHKMPESISGTEKGVTYISDLKNPDTNDFYSAEEIESIKNNDTEKYNELLKSCRKIEVNLMAEKELDNILEKKPFKPESLKPLNPLSPNIEIKTPEPGNILDDWRKYKNVTLIVDNSASMTTTSRFLAKRVEDQTTLNPQETQIRFATFSDKLDRITEVKDNKEAAKEIVKMDKDGSWDEKSVYSSIKALKKMPEVKEGESNLLMSVSDAFIRFVNLYELNELKNLANEKNCEVVFLFGSVSPDTIARAISIKDVYEAYNATLLEKIKPLAERVIEIEDAKMAHSENWAQKLENAMDVLVTRGIDKTKDGSKYITQHQENLNTTSSRITYAKATIASLKQALESGDALSIANNELFSSRWPEANFKNLITVQIDPRNLGEEIELKK